MSRWHPFSLAVISPLEYRFEVSAGGSAWIFVRSGFTAESDAIDAAVAHRWLNPSCDVRVRCSDDSVVWFGANLFAGS